MCGLQGKLEYVYLTVLATCCLSSHVVEMADEVEPVSVCTFTHFISQTFYCIFKMNISQLIYC